MSEKKGKDQVLGVDPVGKLECHASGEATFWPDESKVFALPIGEHPVYTVPVAATVSAEPVAYLDLGEGGYMDVGTDLTDEELAEFPKGRHMLAIIGTYGADGYVSAPVAAQAYDIDRAVEAFQIAEHKCHERLAAAGVVDAPEIGVKEGLLAVIQYLSAQAQPMKVTSHETIDWTEISKRGLLERINREIMHPLGLAVYRCVETGVSGGALVSPDGVWTYGDGSEQAQQPVSGADGELDDALLSLHEIRDLMLRHHKMSNSDFITELAGIVTASPIIGTAKPQTSSSGADGVQTAQVRRWKCAACEDGSGWYISHATGYPHRIPCRYCNPDGIDGQRGHLPDATKMVGQDQFRDAAQLIEPSGNSGELPRLPLNDPAAAYRVLYEYGQSCARAALAEQGEVKKSDPFLDARDMERAEFEKAWIARGNRQPEKFSDGAYKFPAANTAWDFWIERAKIQRNIQHESQDLEQLPPIPIGTCATEVGGSSDNPEIYFACDLINYGKTVLRSRSSSVNLGPGYVSKFGSIYKSDEGFIFSGFDFVTEGHHDPVEAAFNAVIKALEEGRKKHLSLTPAERMSFKSLRDHFEDWWKENMNILVMDLHRNNYPMTRPSDQPYACHETQRGWMAYRAGATLFKKEFLEWTRP